MRIHTGMINFAISLIWGRDNGHTGCIINKAIHSIGSTGKDLSILDITPEFLEKICSQQYTDEGLEQCYAVPDGKDFMIFTTRKNTLFTGASYSDKVHHSAVHIISWSTPQGLSFEHTDCFLGRVSEKKPVELWGTRLKKWPIGWFMLSDRDLFLTPQDSTQTWTIKRLESSQVEGINLQRRRYRQTEEFVIWDTHAKLHSLV